MTTTMEPPPAGGPAKANGNGGTALAKASSNGAGLTFGQVLASRRDLIADVLPKHMTPERLMKLASVAVGRVPKLAQCTAPSLVGAVVKAAELGLDCSGTLGSAYLVPFERRAKDKHGQWYSIIEAQLIIGYRGLIDLARRSGQIVSIEARVVWQNDLFEFEYGLEPRLKHVPAIDTEPGPFRLVYGIAKLRDGTNQVEVMTKADVDAIRERSQSGRLKDEYKNGRKTGNKAHDQHSPWATDYPEMARKTVVKRLCKYLPLSVEFQEAIAADNAADPIDGSASNGASAAHPVDRLNHALTHAPVTDRPVSDGQSFEEAGDVDDSLAAQQAAEGEIVDASTGEVVSPGDAPADPPAAADRPDPDTAGAEAEPPPIDSLTEALDQDWESVHRFLLDTAERAGFARSEAKKAIDAHVKLKLGKARKEATVTMAERRALYAAVSECRLMPDGRITPPAPAAAK